MHALPIAVELSQVHAEARDIAEGAGQQLCTAHVLLAMFTLPNHAQVLLADRGINEDHILAVLKQGEEDGVQAIRELKDRAEQLATGAGSQDVNCLHLLLAMTRAKGTLAYQLLTRSGHDLSDLRTTALGYLTGRMPRRYANFRSTSSLRQEKEPVQRRDTPPEPIAPVRKEVAPVVQRPAPAVVKPAPVTPTITRPVLPFGPAAHIAPAAPAGRTAVAVKEPPPPVALEDGLDPKEFPLLTSLGRNLTTLAKEGGVDPMVGRADEVDRVLDILGKRRANNPCLVGEPGVGKTALVEGLAHRLLADKDNLTGFAHVQLVELDTGSLIAGTALRGSFNERMQGLKEELKRSDGRVIVFIDEVHTLMGAGSSGEGALDAGNELKAALARGEFPVIGATTPAEFKRHVEKDPALARRFVAVTLEEPSQEAAQAILAGAAPQYGEHHGVTYSTDALHAAVSMSTRFIPDRCLPGKAFDIMDLAGSRARRSGSKRVEREDVAKVVAEIAHVPLDRLLQDDQLRFLHMEQFLAERVVGHRAAIKTVAESVRRAYAGFSGRRPMGSFLFLGPTGVGKTELVKSLADFLFGSPDALIRLDMSEYSEAHSVSRLFGAPPGYVGHDDGGQLTDPVRRRPFSVVLLDEVEKAHGDVLLTLLQVLDEGRMTDSKARVVNFQNTLIIMTSNLGSEHFQPSRTMGFASQGDPAPAQGKAALEAARKAMPPELWGRIDERVVFEPLLRDDVAQIARQLLDQSGKRLERERNIRFSAGNDVINHLLDNGGYNASLGARPMRQAVQRLVESALADAILAGRVKPGDRVDVVVRDGQVAVSRSVPDSTPHPQTL